MAGTARLSTVSVATAGAVGGIRARLSKVSVTTATGSGSSAYARLSKVVVATNAVGLKYARVSLVAARAGRLPVAQFTVSTSALSIILDASSSTVDSSATISSYAWNFGDGATATGVSPTHTYSTAGSYTVSLTVTDSNGSSKTGTQVVTASAPASTPISARTGSTNVTSATLANGNTLTISKPTGVADRDVLIAVVANRDSGVTFTPPAGWTQLAPTGANTNSTLQVYARYIALASQEAATTYAWGMSSSNRSMGQIFRVVGAKASSFEDVAGSVVTSGVSSLILPSVTTTHHGDLLIAIAVNHNASIALSSFSVPSNMTDQGQVQFSTAGTTSSLSVATQTTQVFGPVGSKTFGVNPAADVVEGFIIALAPLYPSANVPPVPSFVFSSSGLTVNLDATTSTDNDGYIASFAWNFGDGTTGIGATQSHPYTVPGTYNVSLTVTDNEGIASTSTQAVSVTANKVPPVASASSYITGLVLNLDASSSYDPDGAIFSYTWDFGDGFTATGVTVSHSYASSGTYPVSLTVVDNDGLSNTLNASYTVTARPAGLPYRMFYRKNSDGTLTPVVYRGKSDGQGHLLPTQFDGTWNGSTVISPYDNTPITGPGTYSG